MAFKFRLQSLLQYREHQRQLVQQFLARLLAEDQALIARREIVTQQRVDVLAEMQQLQLQARIDVDQTAARRYHAGQLTLELKQIERQRAELAERIELCRQALVKADQGVKVLEQLADKQRLEYLAEAEKRDARAREETWQAGQWNPDRQNLPVG